MANFFKKITGGIKSIFKGVGKVFKKVFAEVKRFVKSDLFKVIVIAAAIWFGGAALGYWNTGFASVDGALVAGTQTTAQAGMTVGASGATEAGMVSVADTAAVNATGGAVGGTVGGTGGYGAGTAIAQPVAATSTLAAPAATEIASTSLVGKAGAVAKGAAGWMAKNPIPTLLAGQTLAGAFTPNAQDVSEQENQYRIDAEGRAQQYTDEANARLAKVGDIPTWRYSGAKLPGVPGPRLPAPGVDDPSGFMAPEDPRRRVS